MEAIMTTQLTKPVKRRSNEKRHDRGKYRAIIVTIYPAGFIGLRLEGTRREETISIEVVYERAVKMRVAFERAEKKKARDAKKGVAA
jgi:hypothetical protein